MSKRELVQLAHTFKAEKYGIAGWLSSEKLDGQRCWWDGGVSRHKMKSDVPWANLAKDERYKIPPRATGLWSRYGNVIHAPSWFLDALPKIMLDGELHVDGMKRQDINSIIKKLVPVDSEWEKVKLKTFDIPSLKIFKDGVIKNPNMYKIISWDECREFCKSYEFKWINSNSPYRTVYFVLCKELAENKVAVPHFQRELPYSTDEALYVIEKSLEEIMSKGGEGLVVRNPAAYYDPVRSHHVLKIKKLDDAEGVVIGAISGRATDKGSKLLGLMGALILDYNGKRLELSGFTDAERELIDRAELISTGGTLRSALEAAREWAIRHPGAEMPNNIEPILFSKGKKITFKYRGLSKDGIPQEARYWRDYEEL